jgi:hypothetical protein
MQNRDIGVWIKQLETLENAHGLVQCITHPDPGYLGEPGNRRLYEDFLTVVAQRSGLWSALPRDVAAWWRRRDSGAFQDGEARVGTFALTDRGQIEIQAPRH